jgi:hypothetical protein
MEMKKWVDGNIAAAKLFFEKLIDLVWLLFTFNMWVYAFVVPILLIVMVLSFCGVIKNSNIHHSLFTFPDIFALILFFTLSYFYVHKVRKQTTSTSYKFFFMCTFVFGAVLLENSNYRYYVEHCAAGVTKVRAIDAQTKEAIDSFGISESSSKWGNYFSGDRGGTLCFQEGGNLWMQILWMGCPPVSSIVSADGYESKTIILKPNKIDTVTVELQKIKPIQGESAASGQN